MALSFSVDDNPDIWLGGDIISTTTELKKKKKKSPESLPNWDVRVESQTKTNQQGESWSEDEELAQVEINFTTQILTSASRTKEEEEEEKEVRVPS